MWELVFVVLISLPSMPRVTVLNIYTTMEKCYQERDYVRKEMERAYPGDKDFDIQCRPTRVY